MQKTKEDIALVWFKNNLRVHDNEALNEACRKHRNVIGIFYFEPALFESKQFGFPKIEKFRAKFLVQTIRNLKKNLEDLNISLLVYYKTPHKHLKKIIEHHNITQIYLQEEWTSEEIAEIIKIKNEVPESIEFNSYYDQFLIHPEEIGLPFKKIPNRFTLFRKYVEKNVKPRNLLNPIKKEASNLLTESSKIPNLKDLGFQQFENHPKTAFPFFGGESEGQERIEHYFFITKKLGFYKKTRNGLVGSDYSSKFSPWLANGSLSARTIYHKVKEFEESHFKNQSTYWLIFELLWRDYFKFISLKFGTEIFKLNGLLNNVSKWQNDQKLIENWIQGETPEPFVNANMLELKHTGWMSNRGRQNVASYFAKTLKLDWRIGAAYFESLLLDYDVHSNYGNWLYVAGVGNDPRNRVFNVKLQADRYDPHGTFQRLWHQETLF